MIGSLPSLVDLVAAIIVIAVVIFMLAWAVDELAAFIRAELKERRR